MWGGRFYLPELLVIYTVLLKHVREPTTVAGKVRWSLENKLKKIPLPTVEAYLTLLA